MSETETASLNSTFLPGSRTNCWYFLFPKSPPNKMYRYPNASSVNPLFGEAVILKDTGNFDLLLKESTLATKSFFVINLFSLITTPLGIICVSSDSILSKLFDES